MKLVLLLALACAACEDPGLVGPLPGSDPGCTQRIAVDGGGSVPFVADSVVAGGDLAQLKDGTFAAAVERNGATHSVDVVFTDSAHAPLSFDVAAGAARPVPRLAMSASEQPALLWREPDGTLSLGTATARTAIPNSSGAQQPEIAWADATTPAAIWISADGQSIESSLGTIASGLGWTSMAAIGEATGVLVCGIGHRHITFFHLAASGASAMVADDAIDTIAGPLFVRGANPPEIYYVSVITRLAKEQAYLLTPAPGATGRPVASPTTDVPTAVVQSGHLWVLDGDQLTWLAIGTPPVAATLVDASAAVAEPAPMLMLSDGVAALAVVRSGRLEVDFFTAMLVCR